MSEFLEKYLELRKHWSKLAHEGKDDEYTKLVEKAHDELYPKFSREDWEYLIKTAPNAMAKIELKKCMEYFLKF